MIDWLHSLFAHIAGLIALPFAGRSDWGMLILLAIGFAVMVLAVFRWTANQQALVRTRQQMLSALLETALLGADPRTLPGTFKDLMSFMVRHLAVSVKPLLVLILPGIFYLAQAGALLDRAPLPADVPTVISLQAHSMELAEQAMLSTGPGIELSAGPFHRDGTVYWSFYLTNQENSEVTVQFQDQVVRFPIIGKPGFPIYPRLHRTTSSGHLLYGGTGLPKGVREILIDYPKKQFYTAGGRRGWLVPFFAAAILFCIVLAKPMKVSL